VLIREIITEAEISTQISNDLMDLIATYRQDGKEEIPMMGPNGAVTYLRKMGYSVNTNGILDLLTKDPFVDVVERSDPQKITLKPIRPEPTVSPDEMEKSQEKVEKTAAKVANKVVKTGSQT